MKRKNQVLVAGILAAAMMLSSAIVSFAETGWVPVGDSWYYYRADGSMAMDQWVISNGGQFWLEPNGIMAKDKWITTEGFWYYVGSNGEALTGWHEINGKWYYFRRTMETNAFSMATDTIVDGYRINKDGVWVQD